MPLELGPYGPAWESHDDGRANLAATYNVSVSRPFRESGHRQSRKLLLLLPDTELLQLQMSAFMLTRIIPTTPIPNP
jgi:hypothetical protein